jgi:acetylornithine deacetylase
VRLDEDAILALHRELVRTPSVSGSEGAIVERLASFLETHGAPCERIGGSLLAWAGADPREAPLVVFDSHVDTVPPAPGWTRDPYGAEVERGWVYGLGANDAKAAVAAMTAALLAARGAELPFALALALVRGEETRNEGSAEVVAALAGRGLAPAAAVVGEPTALDLAIAQKGLLVLELVARGEAAHAAHAASLGAPNAARRLARDLVALEGIDLEPADPLLGRTTLEPTQLAAGSARNVVPAIATAVLDVRTVPALPPAEVVARVRAAVAGHVVVASERFAPVGTDPGAPLVAAARRARPAARLYGSATLSDLVFFRGCPALKVGPGVSERSHRPDERVGEAEILEGARFYGALLGELAVETRAGRLGAGTDEPAARAVS